NRAFGPRASLVEDDFPNDPGPSVDPVRGRSLGRRERTRGHLRPAMARPRRVPAGGRGGIRRLSNPRRARILRHPSPRGRREGARPRRRRPRLPRPSRNLRTHVPQGAAMALASIGEMCLKERTPTSEFYVVTKNVIDPTVDEGSWRLSIGGLVATPATYDYPQLLARSDPSDPDHADEIVTLECVSNEVGGNLISNARWQGVRLAALLASAGLDPAADWIVFTCADGYTAAIPRDRALNP